MLPPIFPATLLYLLLVLIVRVDFNVFLLLLAFVLDVINEVF